jgi:hypothetical protein
MCRRVGNGLQDRQAFQWYKVVVKNIASGYSAFAATEWPEPTENLLSTALPRPLGTWNHGNGGSFPA